MYIGKDTCVTNDFLLVDFGEGCTRCSCSCCFDRVKHRHGLEFGNIPYKYHPTPVVSLWSISCTPLYKTSTERSAFIVKILIILEIPSLVNLTTDFVKREARPSRQPHPYHYHYDCHHPTPITTQIPSWLCPRILEKWVRHIWNNFSANSMFCLPPYPPMFLTRCLTNKNSPCSALS